MSADALPITAARFAEAISDLSLATLHLKVLEIRNEIAHLDYSNEQLLPYAKGTAAVLGAPSPAATGQDPTPDQDCIDAIQENLAVIERKLGQLRLVRAEVESRGASWTAFQSKEEAEQQQAEAEERAAHTTAALAAARPPAAPLSGATTEAGDAAPNGRNGSNGTNGTSQASRASTGNPWTDGTFQTGTIRNGELQMDSLAGQSFAGSGGGSLTDDQLRRALEERLRLASQNGSPNGNGSVDDDDEEGMHL